MYTRLTDSFRRTRCEPFKNLSSIMVKIEIVQKAFSGSKGTLLALKDILLTIDPGEFVCIVGGSGCGKTTLLRIIAGLETEYEGAVFLDGKKITGTSLNGGDFFQ